MIRTSLSDLGAICAYLDIERKPLIQARRTLLGLCLLSLLNPVLASAQDAAPAADSAWTRSTLTGDWGGARTELRDNGVSVSFDTTHFYQGLISGDGNDDYAYGGRADAMINFDTEKMGLWEGGGFHTHLEYSFGDLPAFRGGALWPVNTAMLLPLGKKDSVVASSLYLSQKLGERTVLMLGKINAVDLLASDPFFGGWGNSRFMNIAFVGPPSGIVMPTVMGAIISHKSTPVSYTFMLLDPDDRTNDYFPDDLFSNGVVVSVGATWSGAWAGRASSFNVTGSYTTADGADFEDIGLPPGLEGGDKTDSYNVGVSLSHLLITVADKPGKGLGVYVKTAIADGNPNVIQGSLIGGIAGHQIVPGRPYDSFGIGYFYYNFSDVLQDAVESSIQFEDEQGVELFYNLAITPWLKMTADVQWVNPATGTNDTMWVGGLRIQALF